MRVQKQDFEMVAVRFEGEDFAVLEALKAHERLNRSDVIRRAVRAYAEKLGVMPKARRAKR